MKNKLCKALLLASLLLLTGCTLAQEVSETDAAETSYSYTAETLKYSEIGSQAAFSAKMQRTEPHMPNIILPQSWTAERIKPASGPPTPFWRRWAHQN